MTTVIDYAGIPPGTTAVKAAGHIGAIRYIAPDRTGGGLPGKPISKQEAKDYADAGLDLAFVWQYGGNDQIAPPDVSRGAAGGREDALAANAHLKAIDRDGWPVFFAVDFNISLAEWNAVAVHYFRAAIEVLGRGRVGVYGHSRVCAWAVEDQVVGAASDGKHLCWQTEAWSDGELAPEACLYQRAGNVMVGATAVDVNEVWASEWGNTPRTGRKPPSVVPHRPTITPPIERHPGWVGDPTWLLDVLTAFGVTVTAEEGWLNRGQGDFREIWGVMAHHTAGNNTPTWLIRDGRADLRGMLSQIHLLRDGRAIICGAGIAWHAGAGSYPGIPTNAGNWHTIGIEANSDGRSPWPPEMLDAYYRICAAICWVLGKSSLRVVAHREYSSQGKWDPGGINMPDFRAHIQHYIDNPPFMPTEAQMTDFWNQQVPSLVNPKKSFERQHYIPLIDYHATLANIQSKQALAELKLLREDIAALATHITGKQA